MNKFKQNNSSRDTSIKVTTKNTLDDIKDGDFFKGHVKILRKAKPGPVIFSVSDGQITIDAVTKDSDFDTDDVVKLSGFVSERAGRLQIEIKTIESSTFDFDLILDEKSNPIRTNCSIKSDRLNIMQPHFVRVAKRIRKAILDNQPIMIRHHNDSDGINAGLAIGQACEGLMNKVGINVDFNLYRSPSKAPFYETGDVFRDIVLSKRITGHGQKKPMVLVLDNGSTPEDIFGLKTLKLLDYDVIVIDHHNPVEIKDGKSSVCPYLIDHINPYLYGLDSQTSAGMLCYEVSRMIDEDFSNPILPAVAAISDRCDIEETEQYIRNSGKSREELGKIGVAIDFVAYHLRFDAGKGLYEEIYTQPEIVVMINEKVNEGSKTQLQSTLPYLRTLDLGGVIFSYIDLEKYTLRFTYPNPGKVVGMIHDKIVSEHNNAPALTIGHLSDMVIVRANTSILPVQEIITRLQEEMPEANADGGGHEQAGAIKFVSAHTEVILEKIKTMLRKRLSEEVQIDE